MISNEIISSLTSRRSIKSYLPRQVENEKLTSILQAATYAPSGMNRQSPYMVAVQNPDLIARLSRLNAEAMGNHPGDPFYGAPTVIVVFGDPDIRTWLEDATLVSSHLLTAAHALGLGACWIHRAREVFASPEGQEMMKQWGIPEHCVGVANIILGYQDQPAKPRVPRKENYYRIVK